MVRRAVRQVTDALLISALQVLVPPTSIIRFGVAPGIGANVIISRITFDALGIKAVDFYWLSRHGRLVLAVERILVALVHRRLVTYR